MSAICRVLEVPRSHSTCISASSASVTSCGSRAMKCLPCTAHQFKTWRLRLQEKNILCGDGRTRVGNLTRKSSKLLARVSEVCHWSFVIGHLLFDAPNAATNDK